MGGLVRIRRVFITLATPLLQVFIANKHQFNDLESKEVILRDPPKGLPATFSSPRRATFPYHLTGYGKASPQSGSEHFVWKTGLLNEILEST